MDRLCASQAFRLSLTPTWIPI